MHAITQLVKSSGNRKTCAFVRARNRLWARGIWGYLPNQSRDVIVVHCFCSRSFLSSATCSETSEYSQISQARVQKTLMHSHNAWRRYQHRYLLWLPHALHFDRKSCSSIALCMHGNFMARFTHKQPIAYSCRVLGGTLSRVTHIACYFEWQNHQAMGGLLDDTQESY